MAQTLDKFLEEARAEIVRFEAMWRAEHAKNPEAYPLELPDGQEGLWWEFLSTNGDNCPPQGD